MTDERFDISRRKALAALGTIGVASAGAGLGTSAYFSDQETFENNQLVAGTLDVGVSYSAHYSDWMPNEQGTPEDEGVPNVRMYDGPAGTTGGPDDLQGDEVGLPSDQAWLIAVSDDDDTDEGRDTDIAVQFLENTQYQSYNDGTLDCVDGEANSQADGEDRPVIDLDDVKPGDFGEVTFDFIICDNPGFVWLNGSLRSSSENGRTEPEADDPDEGDGVELLDVVQAAVWVDDGNNFQNGDEEPLVVGSLNDVLGMDLVDDSDSTGAALNGDIPAEEGGGAADARNCFSAGTEHSLVFAWWVPVDHGNEIQSDTASFDLGLYAEQCRHNDGSGMNNDSVTDGDGDGDGGNGDNGLTFDVYPGDAGGELVAEFTVQAEDDGESLTGITLDHTGGTDVSNTGSGDVDVELNGINIDGDVDDVSGTNNGTTLDITLGGDNSLSTGDTVTVVYGDVQNRSDTTDVTGSINGDGPVTDSEPLTDE